MKFITWDIAITTSFVVLLAYSLLIRKHKSLATLASLYVAYVITSVWGDRVTAFFGGDRVLFNQMWIKANATPFLVQGILLVVLTLLLSAFIKLGGKRSRYSTPEIAFYTLATIALATMFILSFATPEVRQEIMSHSQLATYIYNWREWVLILPVFVMIFFGIYSGEDA